MDNHLKKEVIATILIIIGFIADILSIYSAIKSQEFPSVKSDNVALLIMIILTIIYAWITIAYFSILRSLQKKGENVEIKNVARQNTFGVGIGLLPFYVVLVFTIDIGYKFALIWGYVLLFFLLSIGLQFLIQNIHIERGNKDIEIKNGNKNIEEYDELLFYVFVTVVIVGAISCGGIYGGLFYGDGKYICSFPYNKNKIHVGLKEKVVGISQSESKMILVDSLGNTDTIDKQLFYGHFDKTK